MSPFVLASLQTSALVVALALVALAFVETAARGPTLRVVLYAGPAALLAIFQYGGLHPLTTPPDVMFGVTYGALAALVSVSYAQRHTLRKDPDDPPSEP